MKKNDLVFVDIETTGLNPEIHEIIEIAVVRVTQTWEEGEKPQFLSSFEWSVKIKPLHIENADPVALKVNGYSKNDWKEAVSLKEALTEFSKKTEGAIMVAHNVAFDAGFLDKNMSQEGVSNTMHYHRLDTVSMAYATLHSTPDVNRYSLMELCKYFGIENTDPHSALSDARADFELFKKLMSL